MVIKYLKSMLVGQLVGYHQRTLHTRTWRLVELVRRYPGIGLAHLPSKLGCRPALCAEVLQRAKTLRLVRVAGARAYALGGTLNV